MHETTWTSKVCSVLRRRNAKVFAIVGGKRQEPGWPDRLVWHKYWHGLLEFKGLTTPLKDKQAIIIRELNARVPGSAYIVRYPNMIQDTEGNTLATFDGLGHNLLEVLRGIPKAV